jgi:hypothetical protein
MRDFVIGLVIIRMIIKSPLTATSHLVQLNSVLESDSNVSTNISGGGMAPPTSSTFAMVCKDMLASFIGSACCVYSGQPFDTVKVRMQVDSSNIYRNPFHCFFKIIKEEGPLRLFSGSIPALSGALMENACAFSVNNVLKRTLGDRDSVSLKDKPFYEPFLTGGFTGFCVAFVLCPCDLTKCRAQVIDQNGGKGTIKEVLKELWTKRGFRGLYTGMPIQIIRDILFYGTFFGSYDVLCEVLKEHTNMSEAMVYFTAGGFAGQIGWASSIIPDTIKSTIQTTQDLKHIPSIQQTYKKIMQERGLRGLMIGMDVAIVRAFPANAALFMGYEYTKKFLDKIA